MWGGSRGRLCQEAGLSLREGLQPSILTNPYLFPGPPFLHTLHCLIHKVGATGEQLVQQYSGGKGGAVRRQGALMHQVAPEPEK